MKVIELAVDLTIEIQRLKKEGNSIGFVPTMGALHAGHISLIKKSVCENNITVVSIFVNPTQFNNKQDLVNYPRTLSRDLEMLENSGCDIVFTPANSEMYPEEDTRKFNFGSLERVMEGEFRPGHFNGVAQIVSKLFSIIPANKAYFGEKDFQQLAIIKELVAQLGLTIEIVPCPIWREPDGLAMSSRNMLLSSFQREHAPLIFKILKESLNKKEVLSVSELKTWVINSIDTNSELKTEYFEIVNDRTLECISSWFDTGGKIGCIAVIVGKVRLIDNIRYNF